MGQQQSAAIDIQAIHADRFAAARAAKAENHRIVGLIGSAIPTELVWAAGAFPLALTPRAEDFSRDPAPMESDHEADVRSLFLQATQGTFALCDAIVIASTSDAYRYLFQYLTEMGRTGQGAPLPPIWLYDFLFGDGPVVRHYDGIIVRQLVDRLSALTGQAVTDEALAMAIGRTDRVRAELAKLPALRTEGHLSGTDAMAVIGAGAWIAPETHRALLQQCIATTQTAQSSTPPPSRPRLLVATAVPLYHDRLHRLAEVAGMTVVAEDDSWGARAGGPPIGAAADPWAALIDHVRAHDASPRQTCTRREAWLKQSMAGAIDGVLFYLPPDDQSFGWRYPTLSETAAALGKPSLLIRDDALDPDGSARIAAALAQWTAPKEKASA